jgi:hypothetical protein
MMTFFKFFSVSEKENLHLFLCTVYFLSTFIAVYVDIFLSFKENVYIILLFYPLVDFIRICLKR